MSIRLPADGKDDPANVNDVDADDELAGQHVRRDSSDYGTG
jgi:hypothetical protein